MAFCRASWQHRCHKKNEAYDGGLDSRSTLPNGAQKVWFQLCWQGWVGTLEVGVIFTDNNTRDRVYDTAAAEMSRGGQLADQLNSTRLGFFLLWLSQLLTQTGGLGRPSSL